ncbi:hypothetical protein [Kribbella sp. NPDC048928]|uniref:hypothetical protein n=1 Tax=Kribbella sp. NPDC048928 TaxID=3364111 RepID=UPI003720E2CD
MGPGQQAGDRLPGLTIQRTPPTVDLQAQLIGTLKVDAATDWLVLRMEVSAPVGDGRRPMRFEISYQLVDVAWPTGWSTAIRDGEVALIDAMGQTAAHLGDEVSVGGGFVTPEQADAIPCTGHQSVFRASGLSGP